MISSSKTQIDTGTVMTALKSSVKSKNLPLKIELETKLKVKFWKIKMKKVKIRVRCDEINMESPLVQRRRLHHLQMRNAKLRIEMRERELEEER